MVALLTAFFVWVFMGFLIGVAFHSFEGAISKFTNNFILTMVIHSVVVLMLMGIFLFIISKWADYILFDRRYAALIFLTGLSGGHVYLRWRRQKQSR